VKYDIEKHGWIIEGAPKPQVVFASQMEAENHCIKVLHQAPVSPQTCQSHQELPKKSVWTGAPWDRSFENLN
jgi:hypothetical protein